MTKILVVDDERIITQRLKNLLDLSGYETFTAEDAKKGLEIFEKHRPQVALVDIKMPGMDGIEMLKKIKEKSKQTEVIIITGHGGVDTAIQALKEGAFSYIQKPIEFDELEIDIRGALEKQYMQQKLDEYVHNLEKTIEEKVKEINLRKQAELETERVLKELKETQSKLIHTQKLAAVGQLAAGVAHEINNPLAVILGSIQMVQRYCLNKEKFGKESLGKSVEFLKTAERQTHRCKSIIKNLLDFSKEESPVIEPCNIRIIIEDSIFLVGHQVPISNINIIEDISEDLPMANVNMDQMEQVFINLFLNAVQAMPNGGRLEISARAEGEKVVVKVSDTGCGIKEEDLPRIYDPFFTTRAPGKGTGLGLAVTYAIIKRLNSSIDVESQVGKGTTFTLALPAYKGRG